MTCGGPGLGVVAVAIGLFALCSACSSTGSPSSNGNTGGAGVTSGTLFDDSQVPACDSAMNYRLRGKLAGQDLEVSQFQLTDLEHGLFTILVVVNGTVRTDIALTWSDTFAADKAVPLIGTSLRVPDDQPLGGQSFCVTGGDLGSATPSDPSMGRTVLFRLTGMRQGDCAGTAVDSTLKGCIWRSPDALFPTG